MIYLTSHHYDGSESSANRLATTLINAGYQVHSYAPSNPTATSEMWVEARDAFPADSLEVGFPRDFRALVSGPSQDYEMVLVPLGADLLVEPQGLSVRTPDQGAEQVGVSKWANDQGWIYSFSWDGTIEGFVDLISFFQINGSQLRRIEVTRDRKGETHATAFAYNYARKKEYSFPFEQKQSYAALELGKVTGVTTSELVDQYTLRDAPTPKRFNYTAFARAIFADGIVLVGPPPERPWYQKWWVWLIAVPVLLALIFGVMALTDGPQSEDVVTEEVTEETIEEPEETVDDPAEQPSPEPDPGPAPGNTGGNKPSLPEVNLPDLPDVNLPDVELPNVPNPGDLDLENVEDHLPDGWVWPWEDGFQWPWDDGFRWPWS